MSTLRWLNKSAARERRDCAAVPFGHPWRRVGEPYRSAEDSNANGVAPRSPGLARGASAYPGLSSRICPNNPNGVAPSGFIRRGRNPDGVLAFFGIVPQGSRSFVASTLGSVTERPWRSQFLAKVIRINRRTKSRQPLCRWASAEIIFLSLIFLSIADLRGRPGRLQCLSVSSSKATERRWTEAKQWLFFSCSATLVLRRAASFGIADATSR